MGWAYVGNSMGWVEDIGPMYKSAHTKQSPCNGNTHTCTRTHTHTHTFHGPFSGTTRVSRYQKGKTNLDFTEARD